MLFVVGFPSSGQLGSRRAQGKRTQKNISTLTGVLERQKDLYFISFSSLVELERSPVRGSRTEKQHQAAARTAARALTINPRMARCPLPGPHTNRTQLTWERRNLAFYACLRSGHQQKSSKASRDIDRCVDR